MSIFHVKTNSIYINDLFYQGDYESKINYLQSRIQYCSNINYLMGATNYYQHINYTPSLILDNTHINTITLGSQSLTVKNQFVTVDETITITYND